MQHLYWRQIIACCILLSISLNGFGQKGGINQPDHDDEKFWSGLYFGVFTSNFQYTRGANFIPSALVVNSTSSIESEPGFFLHGGIPITFRVYKNLLFRTGMAIILNSDLNNNFLRKGNSNVQVFKTSPLFFQVPVALKYESDRYDILNYRDAMRHYIVAGATLNYDFSTGSVYYNNTGSPNAAIIKPLNLTYDLGLGLTFIINDYIRISPEIKFSYGINNLIKPAVTNSPLLNLDKLTGNYVSFSLHIEN